MFYVLTYIGYFVVLTVMSLVIDHYWPRNDEPLGPNPTLWQRVKKILNS